MNIANDFQAWGNLLRVGVAVAVTTYYFYFVLYKTILAYIDLPTELDVDGGNEASKANYDLAHAAFRSKRNIAIIGGVVTLVVSFAMLFSFGPGRQTAYTPPEELGHTKALLEAPPEPTKEEREAAEESKKPKELKAQEDHEEAARKAREEADAAIRKALENPILK